MCTKRPTPAPCAASTRSRVPRLMIALELLVLALPDRDEVDDARDALERGPERLGLGHVALDELAAQGLELACRARVADEHAHAPAGVAQRTHDVAADEPGSAGDEDHVHGCT